MSDPTLFPETALGAFSNAYAEKAVHLSHNLQDHLLLSTEALTELALSMRPVAVEYNKADLPVGIDPEAVPANGLDIASTIQTIATNGSWMVLKFIEQNAAYKDFLSALLAELKPYVGAVTGDMLKLEGFIFLSSPNAVTPFHIDPEHNILLQLQGSKTMTIFPADDDEIAPGAAHESFHRGGHRNLGWKDEFASRGTAYGLAPGEAIYVPIKAPHWVKMVPNRRSHFRLPGSPNGHFANFMHASSMPSCAALASIPQHPAVFRTRTTQNHRPGEQLTRSAGSLAGPSLKASLPFLFR
jgi:hypothetical protein